MNPLNYIKREAAETWADLKILDPKNPDFLVALNRVKNVVQGIFVLGGCYTVKNANPLEYIDGLYHLYDAALSKRAPWYLHLSSLILNPIRILDIAHHLEKHDSTVLRVLNYIDIPSHFLNDCSRTYSWAKSALWSTSAPQKSD